MKTCTRCHISKDYSEFNKNKRQPDGYWYYCKQCSKEMEKGYRSKPSAIKRQKSYLKKHYQEHKQEYIDRASKRNKNKKEERNIFMTEYRNKNRETINKNSRKHYHKTHSEKYINNPNYRLRFVLRARIRTFLKGVKHSKTEMLLGCNLDQLKKYLEDRFTPEMNWNNYGSYWQIDHKIPCASFDLSKEDEQKKCFHYSNLQPLTKIENMKKGSKIDNFERILS